MSWKIHLAVNTVEINEDIAVALFNSNSDITDAWNQYFEDSEEDEILQEELLNNVIGYKEKDGKYYLFFNDEFDEHMDYVSDPIVQKILKKHKVRGDVCFSSNEGDNKGQSWGYRFDGKGGMTKLIGTISWTPVATAKKKKKKKPTKLVCATCYDGDTNNNEGDLLGTNLIQQGVPYCYDCGFTNIKEI